MIIGIDGNEANVENKVGIGEYAFQLLSQFSQFRVQSSEFRVYLKEKPREAMPMESGDWKYRIVKPYKLWTQIGLPLDLYRHKPRPAVFFTPTHYAPRFSPVPTVISIMDLSYIHFPELFAKKDLYQLQSWTKYSARNAAKILTISQSSKNDIIQIYGRKEHDVIVTYPGIKQPYKERIVPMNELQKTYGISDKFILFVGTLQPRKNIERLIAAFAKISPSHKDVQLVIIGKPGWLYESILAAPQKYGVEKEVIFLSYVDDKALASFYTHAVCYVLPSLYEGFGLPVLEAMSYGCPVITSNVSSLPEAGGDAALYVNPLDIDDIASQMTNVIDNKSVRVAMIEKGKQQVKKFSWEKTAKETLSVLEQVATDH
ncbi:MAG: glycosyltransferase family 4 protein [Candidatus Levybacteria bacterium]|nr:glycosyltransferase family 4 protein [Candidatus Levybacteria bacterium]